MTGPSDIKIISELISNTNSLENDACDDNDDNNDNSDISSAIEILKNQHASISRHYKINKRINLHVWEKFIALAICRYLELIDNGESKMVASKKVAHIIYNCDPSRNSYKTTCIRTWAVEFIKTKQLPKFKTGKHLKCQTIITDEHFQEKCKFLRA